MKDRLKGIKEYLVNLSKKTKIAAAAVAVVIIAGAVIVALVLNHKDYVLLFSDVTSEETTEILGKLQEMGITYTSDGEGNIRVPEDMADTARAQLAQEGYPKSGFTYDIFTDNAKGMTTDMEKQTYKLYELQNRIGATIRLFDGVKDAKVTIALGEESKYVLSDSEDAAKKPSASVGVMMKDGGSPSASQAKGIQRLVAQSVPNMEMEDVSVLDGSGIIVSDTAGSNASGGAGEEIAQIIEAQLAQKVINVLEPFYGAGNIRVSAKGKVNMEKVIRESTTYSTPEKTDDEDKRGIIKNETVTRESSGGGNNANGVVGTETNSDISQYTADANGNANGYLSESQTRDYLVNQIKEQGEIDTGVLQDVSVSVAINGETLGNLNVAKLQELVGNATGIAVEDRADKVAIANAPFYETEEKPEQEAGSPAVQFVTSYFPFLLVGALALTLLLILLLVLLRRRKKKKAAALAEGEKDLFNDLLLKPGQETPEEVSSDPELVNMQNERSKELRESVRAFAKENPELSAQMIRNWLHGGDENAEQ